MLINAAIDTGLLTLLFFIAGMIKPSWPLFFLAKPDRFMILIISTVLIMISVTLFGEGNRLAKLEQAAKPAATQSDPSKAPDVPSTKSDTLKI